MKKVKVLFLVALAVFMGTLSFTASGCKDNPVSSEIIEDLFPLVVGHKLVFSGHLRNANDEEIAGTSGFYEARMTVAATDAPTPFGTAHVLLDSQLVSPGVWATQSFYIQRAAPEGSGDFGFLTNIGRIYRLFNIQRTDSLQWVLLVNQKTGLNGSWDAFVGSWDGEFQGAAATIGLVVKCDQITRETVTTPGGTFEGAYRIIARRTVTVNTTPVSSGTTAEIWLVPNIGIVKFIFHADGESGGFYREYEDRNF
ncbi:MAG: hypothetical protein L0Y80_11240 [Ignavibacteriae bacterium]|nr:hypothetical protein [Ignavibacteriota bacterium]